MPTNLTDYKMFHILNRWRSETCTKIDSGIERGSEQILLCLKAEPAKESTSHPARIQQLSTERSWCLLYSQGLALRAAATTCRAAFPHTDAILLRFDQRFGEER